MKLYIFPGSCSLASHIVLRELGVEVELESVDLGSKITATGADYLQINPKGYVPALVLDDGFLLTEGVAIMQYMADLHSDKNLAPGCGTLDRAVLVSHMNFIGGELQKAIGPLFTPDLSEDAREAAVQLTRKKMEIAESLIGEKSDYLMGDHFTIADAYLFVVARWLPMVGVDLAEWPKLQALVDQVSRRPAVELALKCEEELQETA